MTAWQLRESAEDERRGAAAHSLKMMSSPARRAVGADFCAMASPLRLDPALDRIERADAANLSRSLPAESTVRSAGSDSSSEHPASSHQRGIAASASSLSLSSEEPGEIEPPLWLEDARARGRSVHRPRA